MFSAQARGQLDSCLELLKERRDNTANRREVTEIVQNILHSLTGDVSSKDIKLYEELESLAQYIRETKEEIAHIRPDDINDEHIPFATDELDAIITATEDATGTILDCAEKIEATARAVDEEQAKALEDCVTRIYEACNFQDITGQRINKVVKTLKHIEERVTFVVAALGHGDSESAPVKKERESKDAADESDLLNGPQLPDNANNQDDIDALFAS